MTYGNKVLQCGTQDGDRFSEADGKSILNRG